MPRFFALGTNLLGGRAIIRGRDAEHIKVLRLRPGEEMTICDGNGTDYKCRLVRSDKDEAEAEIIEVVPCAAEPTVSVRVLCGLRKGDMLFPLRARRAAHRGRCKKARALEQNKRGGGKAVGARHHSRGQMDRQLC